MPSNDYIRTGNRISLLPISQYCGLAAKLATQHGAGRAAAVSSAAHARWGQQPDADKLLALLSDDERRDCLSWPKPTDIVLAGEPSITLDYDSADKEIAVGLDSWGCYMDPATATEADPCLTAGTLDFGWVREWMGLRVAFIGDMKRSAFTTPDGAESLQLHAYGRAYAQKHDCTHYTTGLWILMDAEWKWSPNIVELGSERDAQLWERMYYAAKNSDDRGSTGPHCSGCYERLHCPEYLLPAALSDTWLAPLANGEASLTPDTAASLVLHMEALQKLLNSAEATLKEYARNHPVRLGGKVWSPSTTKGREYVNVSALRAALGPDAEPHIQRARDSERFIWRKAK